MKVSHEKKSKMFLHSDFLRKHLPSLIVILSSFVVVISALVAVYLVDVLNVSSVASERGLWWHLFRNRGPIEWVQWIFLSLTFLSGAVLCGIYWERDKKNERNFWGLLSLTFLFMLIEDAGDPRHVLADYGYTLFDISRRNIEGAVFLLIVLPLGYAVLRYWRVIFYSVQTRVYFFLGAGFYGLAALCSLFREKEAFYVNVGERLSAAITGSTIPGFFLMDFVLEESLELMAAAVFFSGVLVYWRTEVFKQ